MIFSIENWRFEQIGKSNNSLNFSVNASNTIRITSNNGTFGVAYFGDNPIKLPSKIERDLFSHLKKYYPDGDFATEAYNDAHYWIEQQLKLVDSQFDTVSEAPIKIDTIIILNATTYETYKVITHIGEIVQENIVLANMEENSLIVFRKYLQQRDTCAKFDHDIGLIRCKDKFIKTTCYDAVTCTICFDEYVSAKHYIFDDNKTIKTVVTFIRDDMSGTHLIGDMGKYSIIKTVNYNNI